MHPVGRAKVKTSLIREVHDFGRFDLKGCYNCGSCTVSCDVSDQLPPFPRRSIQYVLIGLEGPLKGSLEPWLCSDCGDCSKHCPRDAEPRESMATIRRYLTAKYDFLGLSNKFYRSNTRAAGTLILTGLLVLILISAYHLSFLGLAFSDFISDPVGFEHMFDSIYYLTVGVIIFPLLILMANGYRMYRFTMGGEGKEKISPSHYVSEAWNFFLHAFTQKQMRECPDSSRKVRWIKHLIVASGCALMFILLLFFLGWFQTDNIYPLYHPQRWIGYIVTAALIYVSIDILVSRLKKEEEPHDFSEISDFTFPLLLLLTAVSGIAVHFLRYGGYELAAHYVYAIHLAIAVPLLIIELPFGKWSHMIYRPLARYLDSVKSRAREERIKDKDLEAA